MEFNLKPNISPETSRNSSAAPLWAQHDLEEESSSRYFAFSTALHLCLLLSAAFITVPIIEQIKTETITIEIQEEPIVQMAKGQNVEATRGESIANQVIAPKPSAPVRGGNELDGDDDIVVSKPKAQSRVAKAQPVKSAKAAPAKASTAPKAAPIKAVAATIDDIDSPTLDEAILEQAKVVRGYDDDLGTDFSDVDNKANSKVAALADQLKKQNQELAEENDAFLNSLSEQTSKDSEALLAANRARRAKDYAGIAAAKESENAAAARALALAQARAAALKNSGNGSGQNNGQGFGKVEGRGAGNNGENQSSAALSGSPQGVRKLEQLRQKPGNPIPQYSEDERLNGHQGNVVYNAYVDNSGSLVKFRQLSTTGYTNLDTKTLNALRKWKFYPGQEGWVELPFGWSLKGGAKAVGGTLRSKSAMR